MPGGRLGFAAAWPTREGAFADKLNNDPKYVVSNTLEDPAWQNTTVISGDVEAQIAALRQRTDGVVLVAGSGTLVGTLLRADLVDELRLMVFPTILGRGRRLFPDGLDRLKLTLAADEDRRARRRPGPDLPARRVAQEQVSNRRSALGGPAVARARHPAIS